jgi:photosystem II stability/assembly factor-like uncharacterized protein
MSSGAILVLLCAAGSGNVSQPTVQWEPIGLSGGGAMFTPAISPADPQRMMLNCDMSDAFVTADGGRSWRMIHHLQLRGNTRCRPAFHPTDPRTIYAANGWSGRLAVTHDGGETWTALGNLLGGLQGEIAIDPGRPKRMLAGTANGVWRSADGGKTWAACKGPRGATIGFHVDQSGTDAACFAATAEGAWRSDDGGATWAEKSAGLPWRGLRSFAGVSNAAEKRCVLYCAIPSKVVDGQFAGGVYRSTDRGETWQSAMGEGLNKDTRAFDQWAMGQVAEYHWVLASNVKPLTVYALNANTGVKPPHDANVYRSDDGGATWRPTFFADARFVKTNVEPDYQTVGARQFFQGRPFGAAICAANPDLLMHCDSGSVWITHDGGRTWRAGHTRLAPGTAPTPSTARWTCTGLVVTTTWHYAIDPFEPDRHYIAYTDIGFARSLDAGRTWSWWALGEWPPWQNTCYELAFDPEVPGKVWGAFSNVHDIPNANIIEGRHRATGAGGIALSTDFAVTWKPSSQGLPSAPVTSVVLDPTSSKGGRTLYAGVFGLGVHKSLDDGRTWTPKSAGVGTPANRRVCRVLRHADGTLFALVTALSQDGRFAPEGVGLYRSTDGAETWRLASASQPLLWPKDFAVDPKDSRTIFLGAADAGGKQEGGLYRTTDGGATWKRVARQGREHFGAAFHPRRPNWVYMTLCEGPPGPGLWLSKDRGDTWAPFSALPFANVQRVEFDPKNDGVIYVCTFGGSVWRGPAEPD